MSAAARAKIAAAQRARWAKIRQEVKPDNKFYFQLARDLGMREPTSIVQIIHSACVA
jgi:hypothetical protein